MNPETTVEKKPTNPGLIVLQWLTYAFWGWTVLALSALTASVVANFVDGSNSGNFTSYGIAAVLVLLPISFVCDSFYSKKEPVTKEGAAVWVMVIHAVIFALFGIGALITAVISVVVWFTSSSDSKAPLIVLISALIIAAFYALTFLRALNPAGLHWIQRSYKFMMLLMVGVIAVLGIIGPVARERLTRDDRLISTELPALTNSISDYARSYKKLPDNLTVITTQGDTGLLIGRHLVTYKPEGIATPTTADVNAALNNLGTSTNSRLPIFKYQLCVDYKKASSDKYRYQSPTDSDSDGYADFINTGNHAAGTVCYKMKTLEY